MKLNFSCWLQIYTFFYSIPCGLINSVIWPFFRHIIPFKKEKIANIFRQKSGPTNLFVLIGSELVCHCFCFLLLTSTDLGWSRYLKNVNEQPTKTCMSQSSNPGNSLAIYFQIISWSLGALSSLYRTGNLNTRGQQLREAVEDLGFFCGKVLNVGE